MNKLRIQLSAALFGALFLAALSAAAQYTVYTGLVVTLRVDQNGHGLVQFDSKVGGATCRAVDNRDYMAFDTNTEGGKSIYRMALAAQLAGKQVKFRGADVCNTYAGFEDVAYLVLNN